MKAEAMIREFQKPGNIPYKNWRVWIFSPYVSPLGNAVLVRAVTKSEARSEAKKVVGIRHKDRLPVGTIVVRV